MELGDKYLGVCDFYENEIFFIINGFKKEGRKREREKKKESKKEGSWRGVGGGKQRAAQSPFETSLTPMTLGVGGWFPLSYNHENHEDSGGIFEGAAPHRKVCGESAYNMERGSRVG